MIPFVGPSYSLDTRKADVQRSVNLFPVANEVAGGKTAAYLQSAPGLDLFATSDLALFTIDDVSGTSVNDSDFTLTVTRARVTDTAVSVTWTATGQIFDGTEGFKRADDVYTGLLEFAAGETTKPILFTLKTPTDSLYEAVVTLTAPSAGALIEDPIGTLRTVPVEGLLCHFEMLLAGKTFSVIGPDFAMTGSAALSTTQVKFGEKSGHLVRTSGDYQAAGIQGDPTGRSWRIEGFWWLDPADTAGLPQVQFFTLFSSDNASPAYVAITYTESLFAAFGVGYQNNVVVGGGTAGDPIDKPALGVWNHIAVQYDHATGITALFANGKLISPLSTGADSWDDLLLDKLALASFTGYVDEVYFRYDPTPMYGATYTVPTAPFAPPDE
jgi:hypothetical protein